MSATACINNDQREARQRYINHPATRLCLQYLWLSRDQQYNNKPETAVSTLGLYQQRTTREQPTMPRPQHLCTKLDLYYSSYDMKRNANILDYQVLIFSRLA